MNIVLVEDNRGLNELIRVHLKRNDFECIGYYLASEVISNLSEDKPEMLIIDYSLPDMTGRELVEILEEMEKEIPFLIITGHSDIQMAIDLMKLGARDFVVKDDNFIEILIPTVKRIIAQINIEQKLQESQEALRKREELYRNMVNNLPAPILYHNNGTILFVNKELINITGYPEKELLEKSLTELFPQDQQAIVNRHLLNHCESYSETKNIELSLLSKSGDTLYFFVQSFSTRFDNLDACMVYMSNITKIKQLSKELLGTVIDTENKERTRFARDLHDELGPIMSSVKIYANILSETDKPEKELAEARKQVCELCDLAVQTSRDISNNMMPGNLLQFGLEKALSDFSYRICQSGKFNINLETMLNTRPEKSIEINLYRVITELINNSIKHSGGDKIDIQLMHRKDKLILFFEDNGIGFDYNKVKLDADKIGNGLRNIINRLEFMNARYNIETSPGEGFSLSANLEWE